MRQWIPLSDISSKQQDAHGRVREVMPRRTKYQLRPSWMRKNYPIQMVTSGFPLRGRTRRQQEGLKLDIISDERLPFVGSAIWKNCGLLPGKLRLFHVAWEGEGTSQSFQNSLARGVEGGEFCQQFPVSCKELSLRLSFDLYKHPEGRSEK